MDKRIKRYYKERQHGGKNTAARFMDGLALRLVAGLACYLWYQSNVSNQAVAIAMSAVTFMLMLLALRLYRGLAFDKFVTKERARLTDSVLREKILLAGVSEYDALCSAIAKKLPEYERAYVYRVKKATNIDENDILEAFHKAGKKESLIICSLTPCTLSAESLVMRLPVPTTVITPGEILNEARGMEQFEVSQEEVDAYILGEQEAREKRRRSMQTSPFFSSSAKKYIIAAVILVAASFVTRYALYYRMLAALCSTLGVTVLVFSKSKPAEIKSN